MNMGLQVKTENLHAFQPEFCASVTDTVQQVNTGAHIMTITIDCFCKQVSLGCLGRMVATGRPRSARFCCQCPAGSMDADHEVFWVFDCVHLCTLGFLGMKGAQCAQCAQRCTVYKVCTVCTVS